LYKANKIKAEKINSLLLKLHRLSNKKEEFSGIAHAKSGSSKQIKKLLEIKQMILATQTKKVKLTNKRDTLFRNK